MKKAVSIYTKPTLSSPNAEWCSRTAKLHVIAIEFTIEIVTM